MTLTPEQRAEIERMVKSVAQAKIHEIELKLKEGEGKFTRLEEKLDELREYNQLSHTEFRTRIVDAHEKIETHEPSIEWVRGIRRAWGKIVIALLIAGLVALASGALKVATYFKAAVPVP